MGLGPHYPTVSYVVKTPESFSEKKIPVRVSAYDLLG